MENLRSAKTFFLAQKKRIYLTLLDFLSEKEKSLRPAGPYGPDAIRRLKKFATTGKMVRGCLVMLGYHMYRRSKSPSAEKTAFETASAIELFHSGLLVHDDIMDHDTLRRGAPTIFAQYKKNGEGMGICVGDLAFFLGFELLDPALAGLFSRELQLVTSAQMEDLMLGTSASASKNAILRTYRHKTARYTFFLPLSAGARIAGKRIDKIFEALSDDLGILYQIRDDIIGIFGSKKEIGKTPGVDISENKKTLLRMYLFERAPKPVRKKLENIFGKSALSPAALNYVRKCARQYALPALQKDIERLSRSAARKIEKLPIKEQYRQIFRELLSYGLARTK